MFQLCIANNLLGYQTAFSELMFAGRKEHDPFQNIVDPKEYLAKQLYKLSLSCPGKVCAKETV